MAWETRSCWYRVFVNAARVRVGGDVSIREDLTQLAGVAEFSLLSRPSPEPVVGDPVKIEWIDKAADRVWVAFAGTIDAKEVESGPFSYRITAVDGLADLRRTKTGGDMLLSGSGHTDKDAWKLVIDYCGLAYTDADIASAGLVLGARVPVKWLADGQTTAGSIIAALDEVTGMTTRYVEGDRLVRYPFEPIPLDGTGSARTYTKGTDTDFWQHRRSRGGRDRIQTIWTVRGVRYDFAEGTCQAQVWARAVAGNATIGRRVRVAEAEYQNDLIQDEEHAREIVRRLIQGTNRLPEEAAAAMLNDPRLHPGYKIGIVDPTYGVNAATARWFTIAALARDGHTMTPTLVGGPPGDDGTITTGVEKVCNDLHSDVDWPGTFDFPALDLPALDLGLDLTLPEPPGTPGTDVPVYHGPDAPPPAGVEVCTVAPDAGWVWDAGSVGTTIHGDGHIRSSAPVAVHDTGAGMAVAAGAGWRLRATVFPSANNSVQIGVTSTGLAFQYVATCYGTAEFGGGRVEISTLNESPTDPTDLSGTAVDVVLERDAATQTLTGTFNGAITLVASDVASGVTGTLYPSVRIYQVTTGGLGNGEVTNLRLCSGGEGTVVATTWHAHYGAWGFVDPTGATFTGAADALCGGSAGAQFAGYAYATGTGLPADGTQRIRFSGHLALSGTLTDAALFVGLQSADETGVSSGFDWATGNSFNAYSWTGFTNLTADLTVGVDFALDWNPGNGTFSLLVVDPVAVSTLANVVQPLGTWPAAARLPVLSATGNHCAMGLTATNLSVRVGG